MITIVKQLSNDAYKNTFHCVSFFTGVSNIRIISSDKIAFD